MPIKESSILDMFSDDVSNMEELKRAFQEASIVPGRPELTKACLDCGHCFHAYSLVYHFMRSGMLCPVCRKGIDLPLAARTFDKQPWFNALLKRLVMALLKETQQKLGCMLRQVELLAERERARVHCVQIQ